MVDLRLENADYWLAIELALKSISALPSCKKT